jgi:hypothetical protein
VLHAFIFCVAKFEEGSFAIFSSKGATDLERKSWVRWWVDSNEKTLLFEVSLTSQGQTYKGSRLQLTIVLLTFAAWAFYFEAIVYLDVFEVFLLDLVHEQQKRHWLGMNVNFKIKSTRRWESTRFRLHVQEVLVGSVKSRQLVHSHIQLSKDLILPFFCLLKKSFWWWGLVCLPTRNYYFGFFFLRIYVLGFAFELVGFQFF